MNIADISADEIARIANECSFSGVVSVSPLRQGATIDLAFGFADRGHRTLNHIETRFAMASGSKVFTAVAVGLLIQEGKVKLRTHLAECLPSRELYFASEITIEQLLNHTSGIPDYFDEERNLEYSELWRDTPCYRMTSVGDFVPLFEDKPMKAPPGKCFLYSNSGYVLLGLVIEELTGRDFRDFIRDRIFLASDMLKTGYFALNALPENTAIGYLSQGRDEWNTNIYSLPSIGGPDGGAYTTAGDMRLFWASLLTGRLLSPELVDQFISPSVQVTDVNEFGYYGYGVWVQKGRENCMISVRGNDPGVSMFSRIWLSDGLIMTVLSNVQDGARYLSRSLLVERE